MILFFSAVYSAQNAQPWENIMGLSDWGEIKVIFPTKQIHSLPLDK